MVKRASVRSVVQILTQAENEISYPAEKTRGGNLKHSKFVLIREQLRKIKAFRSSQKKCKHAVQALKP